MADRYFKHPDGTHRLVIDDNIAVPEDWVFLPEGLPPVAKYTLAEAKQAVVDHADRIERHITGPIPAAEKQSWPGKSAAAKAHQAGAATPEQTALLTAEASLTGETLDQLVPKIIAAAGPYEMAAYAIAGLRRDVFRQLDAEPDPVKFEAILVSGKAKAADVLAAQGFPPLVSE